MCNHKMSAQIVSGILVEEPNKSVIKWIPHLCLAYLCYETYIFLFYIQEGASGIQWAGLVIYTFVVGIQVPLWGLRAAKASHSKSLNCFGSLQGCLGCWHMMSALSLAISVAVAISICSTCKPVFVAGNDTCLVDEFSFQGNTNTLEISVDDCVSVYPSLHQIITFSALLVVGFLSCIVSFKAREPSKRKIAEVITIEGIIPVGTFGVVPQIPEDSPCHIETSDPVESQV